MCHKNTHILDVYGNFSDALVNLFVYHEERGLI